MAGTKTVKVGEYEYRISRMTPLLATQVHNWFVNIAIGMASANTSNIRPSVPSSQETEPSTLEGIEKKANGTIGMLWMMSSAHLTEQACNRIREAALALCEQKEGESYVPVMMRDGSARIAVKGFDEDKAPDLEELITISLQYSLIPFFTKGLLAERAKTAPVH